MRDHGVRDDFERLRLEKRRRIRPEPHLDGGGLPSFVGQVVSSGSNIAVGKFLLVTPMSVMGSEVEGASGSLVLEGKGTVPVFLLGPGLPSSGDSLICRFVDHRWVAERTSVTAVKPPIGGGGIPYPGCSCNVPATLTMTSASETCNYNMFQSCTIAYGPSPAMFSGLGLGADSWISTQSFLDPLTSCSFYYYLGCSSNLFYLTRLYPTSPYGSPFRDATLYTWSIGGYGNSCVPFRLDNGSPYPGSQASCFVTIDDASL